MKRTGATVLLGSIVLAGLAGCGDDDAAEAPAASEPSVKPAPAEAPSPMARCRSASTSC